MAAHGELGAGKVALGAIDGLVIVEVVAGKMEDASVFEFEEIMRTFLSPTASTRKARSAQKAGRCEKFLASEFIGELVHLGLARQRG